MKKSDVFEVKDKDIASMQLIQEIENGPLTLIVNGMPVSKIKMQDCMYDTEPKMSNCVVISVIESDYKHKIYTEANNSKWLGIDIWTRMDK